MKPRLVARILSVLSALSVACLALVQISAGAAASAPDEPKPAWRNGPVRYILSPDEDKAYKTLKTDEDRKKAIEEFWAHLDPTPATPENEYRTDFYERVDLANKQFREGATLGWMTDRGKLLIVAGNPDERTGAGEEKETWVYSSLKQKAPGKVSRIFRVVFQRNESGEFKMSSEGDELIDLLRGLEPREAAKLSGSYAPAEAKPATTASGQAPAPGGPAPLPPEIERLRQAAAADTPKTELALETRVRYFEAEDKSTYTVLVFAVKKSELTAAPDAKPTVFLYARIVPKTAAAPPVEMADQPGFAIYEDTAEGWIKYARWVTLPAGSYELKVAVSDGAAGKIAVRSETITLPDYTTDALTLSSVTLARLAEPAPADLDKNSPWRFGSLRLIPRLSSELGPNDDLSFFYRVYSAKNDAGSGKPSLDISYGIEKNEASGWVKKLKTPISFIDQHDGEYGYTIPAEALTRWPAGAYRVSILAKDRVSGQTASSTLEFSVRK